MKPINEQISSKFIAQARKLDQYTRILHQILPIECRNHVQIANIRQQNLMLITDSPVWTTRLRQLSPQILQFLRENTAEDGQIIHHVQISTRYQNNNVREQKALAEKNRLKPSISETTANLLSQSANSIDDQQLKEALLRVASHSTADNMTPTIDKQKKPE
ncbi:MAG: DUF721 domain-containing protein [Gammaproteobacteria bacterium]|jgi:hypothetical protein|nr:DUF721 domain-containing protein [Gammaproteobacteria bacterium]